MGRHPLGPVSSSNAGTPRSVDIVLFTCKSAEHFAGIRTSWLKPIIMPRMWFNLLWLLITLEYFLVILFTDCILSPSSVSEAQIAKSAGPCQLANSRTPASDQSQVQSDSIGPGSLVEKYRISDLVMDWPSWSENIHRSFRIWSYSSSSWHVDPFFPADGE